MRAIAAGLTDVGVERNHNEDRFVILPEHSVFVVADGMGGHQSGEVASRLATSTIAGFFRSGTALGTPPAERLRTALADANAKIHARSGGGRSHRGMGTTAVALSFASAERKVVVAHAGDSRCYRVRGGELEQMTRDHSLYAEALAERPDLSAADLAYLPKNVITRALGITPSVEIDVRSEDAAVGDAFLLCSDGLHGLVSDAEIVGILREHPVLTDACARLVKRANDAGGKDNITVVLVRIEADDEPWSRRSPSALPPR
jgi:protein phosphatase